MPIDEIMYTIWGEGANQPSEGVIAMLSTVLNNYDNVGDWSKVLNKYNAYRNQSPQYKLIKSGKLNTYEKAVNNRNATLFNKMLSGEIKRIPRITHFENLKIYPEPDWAPTMDIIGKWGDQTFYAPKENPRDKVLQGQTGGQ